MRVHFLPSPLQAVLDFENIILLLVEKIWPTRFLILKIPRKLNFKVNKQMIPNFTRNLPKRLRGPPFEVNSHFMFFVRQKPLTRTRELTTSPTSGFVGKISSTPKCRLVGTGYML